MTAHFPLEPSLWHATAAPAPDTPPLEASTRADVCVVGGGYAGLSTALHLAERGIDTVLLEAHEPGWGASGRNGGQVIPGLKHDPDEIVRRFGRERGRRLVDFAGGTADLVFSLIEKHGMDVARERKGWIQAAHSPAAARLAESRAEQWSRHGVAGVRALDAAAAQNLLGSSRYAGGWVDPRGGAVQPLSYARGLARAAIRAGARIHGLSPAAALARTNGTWTVATGRGPAVTAERVVLCTNAYTQGLLPRLEQTIIAPASYQIATAPLTGNMRRSILPQGHVCSDTRNLLFYFRLDHEGRLVVGGRGPLREPRGEQDWRHLVRVAGKLFPQVEGMPIVYRWCGRVALTRDFLPHLHEPAPGLLVDIGCMGRGVGLQTAMGKAMAEYAATGKEDALPLPLAPVEPLPLHGLHRAYLAAIVAWYRLRDGGLR